MYGPGSAGAQAGGREFPAHSNFLGLVYARRCCGEGLVPCVSQGYWTVL